MADNLNLFGGELSNSHSCFGVAKIDKSNLSWLLLKEILLPEETIPEGNSSALINDTGAFEPSNSSSV